MSIESMIRGSQSATTFREKERKRKASWRNQNRGIADKDNRPFIGVDGEGGTTTEGSHDYFLLRAGEQVVSSGFKRLTTDQCLTFLCDNVDQSVIPVAFFFDYDVTKICTDLSFEKAWKLLHREERMRTKSKNTYPFPVDVLNDTFQIEYLPGKMFKVRRNLGDKEYGPWVEISDVGSFFQCAFAVAIETWEIGTPEGREAISIGKAHRNRFDARELPDIDRYNHLECRYLAELMERFRESCRRSGYVPGKWQGPGQIAETMMRVRGIPKRKDIPLFSNPRYRGLIEFANNAFYGGRPEITILGPAAPVWQYDINSAYPWALLHVPCLVHGSWRHGRTYRRGDLALVYGSFKPKNEAGKKPRLYGLPVRRENGSIYYPGAASGWYWSIEIDAASHQSFTPEEAWTYRRNCDCQPFSFVRDVYALRVRIGKDKLGLVLKLALNSLYGKMAQSIGSPAYANPIWASYITAFCRTQIQNLIHSGTGHRKGVCGSDIIMVATDAVFSTNPLPVSDSKELGGYSVKELPDGIFIVQPGMYYSGNANIKPKTRGVPRNLMEEKRLDFVKAYREMTQAEWMKGPIEKRPWGSVDIPLVTFVGLRLALHRHKRDLAGQWIDQVKTISFDCTSKRDPGPPTGTGEPLITYPYPGGEDIVTVPYSKEIGRWREELRLETVYDQPDWVSILTVTDLPA